MASRLPVTSLPEVPAGERKRPSGWAMWALRVAALIVLLIGVALAWLAHRVLAEAAHPVDETTAHLVSTAVLYSLVAAMFVGAGAWGLLGGHSRQRRLVAVAAPASTLAVLPWTAIAGWGVALNAVAGVVAAVAWLLAAGLVGGPRWALGPNRRS
jgi:hypothetical protein